MSLPNMDRSAWCAGLPLDAPLADVFQSAGGYGSDCCDFGTSHDPRSAHRYCGCFHIAIVVSGRDSAHFAQVMSARPMSGRISHLLVDAWNHYLKLLVPDGTMADLIMNGDAMNSRPFWACATSRDVGAHRHGA
jgi:hypothetical protein